MAISRLEVHAEPPEPEQTLNTAFTRGSAPSMYRVVSMAHRFMLVGYLSTAIGAWMLVKSSTGRAGFVWFAIGATLQLVGGLLQH